MPNPRRMRLCFPSPSGMRRDTLPVFRAEIDKKATYRRQRADSEEVKDQLAERQARAAVALIRMGKAEEVWPLLRHSADPRLRSFIVNWLKPLEADPKLIAAELDRISRVARPTPAHGQQFMDAVLFHPETSMRRALILALGTFGTEGLSPGERELLIGKLLDLYRNDPDSGIHGAAEWTLRKWEQEDKLKQADAELMKIKERGDRRWFVNSQGQTFAVIDGPVEFRMGSPPTSRIAKTTRPPSSSHPPPVRHRRQGSDRRAVSTVRSEWKLGNSARRGSLDRYSPDPDGPMIGVSWFGAAAYCNWLSQQEGLPEDQWCYIPNAGGEYDAGMTIPADALKRTGYRLPTEAEWEYACRAGTVTSRYYGHVSPPAGPYAWYAANGRRACLAVRQPAAQRPGTVRHAGKRV